MIDIGKIAKVIQKMRSKNMQEQIDGEYMFMLNCTKREQAIVMQQLQKGRK